MSHIYSVIEAAKQRCQLRHVTASAASPDKRRLGPICQRISELRAHACGRRRRGESLSWMLRAVADSQYSRRSCRYDIYIIRMTMLELTRIGVNLNEKVGGGPYSFISFALPFFLFTPSSSGGPGVIPAENFVVFTLL